MKPFRTLSVGLEWCRMNNVEMVTFKFYEYVNGYVNDIITWTYYKDSKSLDLLLN